MKDRKLRLALPLGKLVEPSKWNVARVLKLAGIVDYHKADDVVINVLDKELEVLAHKPRDIGRDLISEARLGGWLGTFDLGITGKDLVEESGLKLTELCDLGCGYVDLFFMTTQQKWQKAQQIFAAQKTNLKLSGKLTDLELFLIGFSWDHIRCRTEYPRLALKYLQQVCQNLEKAVGGKLFYSSLEIQESGGRTEEQLVSGAAHIAFETVATGRTYKRRYLVLLGDSFYRSTAHAYINPELDPVCDEFNPELERTIAWKVGKINDLRTRIEAVTRDVGEHCQVSFSVHCNDTFLLPSTDSGRQFWQIEKEKAVSSHFSVECLRDTHGPDYLVHVDLVIPKRQLEGVRRFLVSKYHPMSPYNKMVSTWEVPTIQAWETRELYRYCPLLTDLLPMTDEGVGKVGKYPCADSSKLRPEHRKQAVLFELPEK